MTNKEKALEAFKRGYSDNLGEDFDVARLPEVIDRGAFDSLDQIEMLMWLEEKLAISIPDEEAEKCQTFQALLDLVVSKMGPEEVPA